MAQYELTTKQKAEMRKQGHVSITRNGKQVRVTPSMVKATGPAKRATGGKVKAKGKGRKGTILYSPEAYLYNKSNPILSHHVEKSANVLLSDGRVVTVSDNPRIFNDQREMGSYNRGDTSKGTAVYGSTPVARRQAAEIYIQNNTPRPTVLSSCDSAGIAALRAQTKADRCTRVQSKPNCEARYQKFYANNPTYANFIKSIQSRSTPTTTRSSCSRCRS